MNKRGLISALPLSLRAAVSAGLAIALAYGLHLPYPLYALVGAVIVTDLSPLQTRKLGVQRLVGTVLGAAVGATISHFVPSGLLTTAFSIFLAMFLSHILNLKDAAKVSGYVCGIIVFEHHDHQWSYAFYRLVETMVGIGVALTVSFVPKLISVDKLETPDS